MKISVVTPTYNRAKELDNLYKSLVANLKHNISFEWVIMDDGSSDNTKEVIDGYISENKVDIKYYFQENQGKMQALNNVMDYAEGDLIIECDSDDYFTDDAFEIVKKKYELMKMNENVCAMIFPRKMINHKVNHISKDEYITTMFELYFKEGLEGDTTIVFDSEIRKKFKHKLEKDEKFITEARMYHQMDLEYNFIYFNDNICISEYLEDGYSKNIYDTFKKCPYGYLEYFKELINLNMQGVKLKKRLYIIKHYILFSYMTKQKNVLKNVKNIGNKILTAILLWPGYLKSYIKTK